MIIEEKPIYFALIQHKSIFLLSCTLFNFNICVKTNQIKPSVT